MALVTLQDIYLSYGQPPLIDQVNLSIERGERVCLIGRNGAGKSTLLNILTGKIIADDGVVKYTDGVRIAQLEQAVPQNTQGSVFDVASQLKAPTSFVSMSNVPSYLLPPKIGRAHV